MKMVSVSEKIVQKSQLLGIRTSSKNKKIVFCTGCYDILQSGHAVFFNQCKRLGDILIVGIGRDEVIKKLKGHSRPINPENNRVYLVAAMGDVDYAVLNDTELKPGKIDFESVLTILRPDVFVVNDDDSAIKEKQELCSLLGIKLVTVSRDVPVELEASSTTHIIDKINFSYKAPLRIDFAGGWTDVPQIMANRTGCVVNGAIRPHIELQQGKINFGGYPRGSGLSTSTAVKLLEMISSKNYNIDGKSLEEISEDLFLLENKELNWAIGRQDQYSITYGGINCFEFFDDRAVRNPNKIERHILEEFKSGLLLLHTGVSRNAQKAVKQVYEACAQGNGQQILEKMAELAKNFYQNLTNSDFIACAQIMDSNFELQKRLAPATSNETIDSIYSFAKSNGAYGGKICGAGGGGAFIFYAKDVVQLTEKIKANFVDTFEMNFEFEYSNIKELNYF